MKLNKPLIRKMIKRIETKPLSYDQGAMYAEESDSAPCGTVACLAGEAAICSKRTEAEGIKFALGRHYDPFELMGIDSRYAIFNVQGSRWPEPFRTQYRKATTRRKQAAVAVDLLKAILRTDGKILEGE